jgi:hypothetical protein
MKRLVWYACCCWALSSIGAVDSYASPAPEINPGKIEQDRPANLSELGRSLAVDSLQNNPTSLEKSLHLAQTPPPPPGAPSAPVRSEAEDLQNQLRQLNQQAPGNKFEFYQPRVSPGFSIANPTGFGADNNLGFAALSFQSRTRFTRTADGELGIGIGLGDAVNSIGAELSYSMYSFGTSTGFGSGAFNIKLHKRVSEDTAVAIGWNRLFDVNIRNGRGVDFDYPKNSYYAAATKILRVKDDINEPFSRVAVTGGIGGGQFLSESTLQDAAGRGVDPSGLGVFGSVGVRVARPVSAILEWTGQDLAAGLSISPFDSFPLVITPAVRDITGAGDGARFIMGAGVAINF